MKKNHSYKHLTNIIKKSIMNVTASVSFLTTPFRKKWKVAEKALTDWSSFQSIIKSPFGHKRPLGRRRKTMKQFMMFGKSGNRGSKAAALATLATAFLLVACGGGGDSTPTALAPTASITIIPAEPATCKISQGTSYCMGIASYTSVNATEGSLKTAGGETVTTGTSASNVPIRVYLGTNTYTVTATGAGGTVRVNATAIGECAPGSVANGNVCDAVDGTPPVLTVRASTPSFTTAVSTVSALIYIDANETLGATASGIPLGTIAVSDATSATSSITVGFPDATRKAVKLLATGLSYAKNYTATFTLSDLSGNATSIAVPFTTPADATTPVLHYTDVIIANTDEYGWYPMKLVLTSGATSGTVTFSAEKAVNATSFQVGFYPLANCIFNKTKLATGAVKLNCQDAVSLARHNLVWNPVTNRITEYDDSEGAYPTPSDATWVDVQVDTPPIVGWDAFAEIGAGWIVNTDRTLYFKRKSDGTTQILSLSIGLIKAFASFSN
jgi:hypothetical protein